MTEKSEVSNEERINLSPGELMLGEVHPSAFDAHKFICSIPKMELLQYQESLASVALSENRLADICNETLRRLLAGESVSDRYLLGLAWQLIFLKESKNVELSKTAG